MLRRILAGKMPLPTCAEKLDDPFIDLAHHVGTARLVYDVGAYVGDVSAAFVEALPDAVVYAFEPHPASFAVLSSREMDRLRPIQAALGDRNGRQTFHTGPLPYTSSLLKRPEGGVTYYPPEAVLDGSMCVTTVTVDSFAAEHGTPDILKIDVQGAELRVLRGAVESLTTIRAVLVELQFVPLYSDGARYFNLCAVLEDAGLQLYRLYDLHHAPTDGRLVYGDALFLRDVASDLHPV